MQREEEYLPLSGIQHFCFCRRQWALIHVEEQWAENRRTAEGRLEHARCHDEGLYERRGDLLTVRGLRVVSHRLQLSGICDVVEFRQDPGGIALQGQSGRWSVLPVEYKHGRPKDEDADRLQLCAQAMALEEMLVCSIPQGALYYAAIRHREQVELAEELRKKPGVGQGNERVLRARLHPQGAHRQALRRLFPQRAVPARALQKKRCRRLYPQPYF